MIPRPDYPWIVILTMLFAIPTTLLANCAPKRGGFGIRAAIALAGLFVVFGIVDTVNMAFPRPDIADLPTFVPSIIGFGTSIIALSAAAFICYDMSIWVAAFCGTAGYICQNMGNRLGSILGLLFPSAPGLLTGHHNGGFGFIGALIVYAAVCLLMVRPVRRYGLTGIDNRHMLLMTIVVIFEDNGWPGIPDFFPTTVRTSLQNNWHNNYWVNATDPNREKTLNFNFCPTATGCRALAYADHVQERGSSARDARRIQPDH